MKVRQAAFFEQAVFQGPVDFRYMDVGITFNADTAQFQFRAEATLPAGLEAEVDARFMNVCQRTYLRDTSFAGKVSLAGSHFLDLYVSAPEIEELCLERGKIARELQIHNPEEAPGIKINKLQCQHLQVEGPAILREAEVDFRDAGFQQVKLIEIAWPKEANRIKLDGLTYRSITTSAAAGDQGERADSKKLLAWLRQSRFNTRNYRQFGRLLAALRPPDQGR